MQRFAFDIDVVGACNLRCPSCPQGNITEYRLPQGFMEPELLVRIIAKAKSECRVTGVGLFSWAEPMLHPRLPELVRIVKDAGIPCYLSSNLNILRNADAIMAANPFSFRISVSGFTQEVYGRTHRGGDIERVKKHMVELAEAKKRANAATRIYVYYHRYRHNLKEEPLMREFAAGLGIGFEPVWALLFPVEKLLAYLDEKASPFPLTDEDRKVIDLLALPLREALEVSGKHKGKSCCLRDAQISMDFRGNVQLCCGIFDAARFTLGNFLDMSLDEMQKIRKEHPMCRSCLRTGANMYVTYGLHQLEELAAASVSPEDAALLDLRHELVQKRIRRGLEGLHRTFLAGVVTMEQKAALGSQFDRVQRLFGKTRRLVTGKRRKSGS